MRKRTRAREIALQILYLIDISGDNYQVAWKKFWDVEPSEVSEEVNPVRSNPPAADAPPEAGTSNGVKEFSGQLVKGTIENLKLIDEIISNSAENWRLSRMAVVERNILRLASYELLFCPQIPPIVSINEAVDLAKKYSGLEAGKFVNGILDKIRKSEGRNRNHQ